jgi:quinol monooxygenase YgiN
VLCFAVLTWGHVPNRKFAEWVKHNEPATYTYAVLVSSANSREVMMFERYRDAKAIAEHGARKEFKAMFKEIAPFVENKKTVMAEWEELEGSFVGGGEEEGWSGKARL